MIIGILQVELTIDQARSLKDKRRVIASIKDRLHREHQVSVAETDAMDDMHRAVIGIAMATSSVPTAQASLDRIMDKLRAKRDCYVSRHNMQILTGSSIEDVAR